MNTDRSNDAPTETDSATTQTPEAIRSASAEVFTRHAVSPAGPGEAAAGSAPALAAQTVPGQAPAPIDLEVVRKSVAAVAKAVDSHLQRRIYPAALKVSDDPEFAAGFVAETALTDKEADTMGELTAVVMAKHNVTAKYAPEFALVFTLGTYGGRIYFALRKLEQLHAEKMAALKAKEKN